MNSDEEYFRQKYLKYKQKYLELQNQQGGITTRTGIHVVFFNRSEATFLDKQLNINKFESLKSLKPNTNFLTVREMKKIFGLNGVFLKNKTLKCEAINKTNLLIKNFNIFLNKIYKIKEDDKIKEDIIDLDDTQKFDFHYYSTFEQTIELEKHQKLKEYLNIIVDVLNTKGYNIDAVFIVNINKINKNKLLGYFQFEEKKLELPTNDTNKKKFIQSVAQLIRKFIKSFDNDKKIAKEINEHLVDDSEHIKPIQNGGIRLFDGIFDIMKKHEFILFPIWFPLLFVYCCIHLITINKFDLEIFYKECTKEEKEKDTNKCCRFYDDDRLACFIHFNQ